MVFAFHQVGEVVQPAADVGDQINPVGVNELLGFDGVTQEAQQIGDAVLKPLALGAAAGAWVAIAVSGVSVLEQIGAGVSLLLGGGFIFEKGLRELGQI